MSRRKTSIRITAQTLSGIALLAKLSEEERLRIAAVARAHQFEAGDEIIAYKDDGDDVYFLVSGAVRATIFAYTGRKVSFRDIASGEHFGEWSAIIGGRRSSNVVALAPCLALSLSARESKGLVLGHPEVGWQLLADITRLARDLSDRVVEFSTLGVNNRLHAELLRLARDDLHADGTARISGFPTHEELASRISTRREAVNRELRHLEAEGLIERDGRDRIVTDVERLEEMVREAGGS